MKFVYKPLFATVLTVGLLSGGGSAVLSAAPQNYPVGNPYPAPYTDLRGLIDRTQNDLRTASELEHGNAGQRERYHSAQGHLSTFDRHLVKGHFDKGELDKSINEVKSILDHNVLQVSTRDMLGHDLEDLRAARDRRY